MLCDIASNYKIAEGKTDMNVLLMTIGTFHNFSEHGIYIDLLRYFRDQGHSVFIACTREKREGLPTCTEEQEGVQVLRVRIGNITKVNFIEKGISTLMINRQFSSAIYKYFNNVNFDILLYSTPPITLTGAVGSLKRRCHSFTYLLLKDIFPAGAVDLGVLSKTGIKGIIYRYFRGVEKKLYNDSECIGCMSMKNKRYLLEHNPQVAESKVSICPNTIDVIEKVSVDKQEICKNYGIPESKLLLMYGGNFGLPQNIDYVVSAMESVRDLTDVHFVMCGSGTEFYKIQDYGKKSENNNVTIINTLPYVEYVKLLATCDAGMLFLDYRFQVPNFPSRILDYLNYELPVIAATDVNTDVGQTILNGEFGWWCESREISDFREMIKSVKSEWKDENNRFLQKGKNAKKYLELFFCSKVAYDEIIASYNSWKERIERNEIR